MINENDMSELRRMVTNLNNEDDKALFIRVIKGITNLQVENSNLKIENKNLKKTDE